jgi:hypothetical protein
MKRGFLQSKKIQPILSDLKKPIAGKHSRPFAKKRVLRAYPG